MLAKYLGEKSMLMCEFPEMSNFQNEMHSRSCDNHLFRMDFVTFHCRPRTFSQTFFANIGTAKNSHLAARASLILMKIIGFFHLDAV